MQWTIGSTEGFKELVADYRIEPRRVDLWKKNLRRHPLLGKCMESENGLALYEYEVEGFVVTYLIIASEAHIEMMTIDPLDATGGGSGRQKLGAYVRSGWRLLVDAASIYGGFK